ncbi:MAG: hypothetical protein D8M58_12965 [Calditrichaeota bacterium]|nr:MAG: hypothetical protein DWQ03_13750 [Calditrichota bacterium]MBL1206310.1 hypothetical protein [Calditrichota bacterium]NOG46136.1 hypothetical protein [Calditrichota bacterium]
MKLLTQFESQGNIELLSQKIIAVFSSKETPKEIYPFAEKLFSKLMEKNISIAGGWQAPLEKKMVEKTNNKMQANIIFYTAKDLSQLKISQKLHTLDDENKLLLISAQSRQKRAAKSDIDKRDNLLFKQVSQVLFLYVSSGGRLEEYFNTLHLASFPLLVLQHPLNEHLLLSGCPAINEDNVDELI